MRTVNVARRPGAPGMEKWCGCTVGGTAQNVRRVAEILVAVPCGALKAAAEHPVVVAVDADLRRVVMGSKGFLFHVILLCTEKCRQSGRKGSCAIGSSPQTVTV